MWKKWQVRTDIGVCSEDFPFQKQSFDCFKPNKYSVIHWAWIYHDTCNTVTSAPMYSTTCCNNTWKLLPQCCGLRQVWRLTHTLTHYQSLFLRCIQRLGFWKDVGSRSPLLMWGQPLEKGVYCISYWLIAANSNPTSWKCGVVRGPHRCSKIPVQAALCCTVLYVYCCKILSSYQITKIMKDVTG
jgi:hypothetical protein